MIRRITIAAACAVFLLAAPAQSGEMTKCEMKFDLKGWSFIYKQSKGSGRITCSNGQAADVSIATQGGGVTFGTEKIIGGHGSFSSVHDISDLYGSYGEATAHAGAGASASARVMMKGNVNLTIAGTGQGISLGVAFGAFTIKAK